MAADAGEAGAYLGQALADAADADVQRTQSAEVLGGQT